jgi:hypothetical protein
MEKHFFRQLGGLVRRSDCGHSAPLEKESLLKITSFFRPNPVSYYLEFKEAKSIKVGERLFRRKAKNQVRPYYWRLDRQLLAWLGMLWKAKGYGRRLRRALR